MTPCPPLGINTGQTQAISKGIYRPEIDGLRAFAVVAVIINHFNKDLLPGGYLGVDIFFVISGYVITSSLFGRTSKDFRDFISGFSERRIKRLVPALSIFVLITSISICLFNPSPVVSLRTGLTSLFGLSNLYLLKQSTDYFAQSTELNVFTHTWSLGVEEQFYILFPFLIWFSGFGRQTKNGARNLFLIVGVLTVASLIGFLYLYSTNKPAAYLLMPSRFWEMAVGCLIFIGFQKRASIEQSLEKLPPLLVLALIVGVMYLPMSMASTSTIAVVALSSILIASLKKQTAAFKVFSNTKVVYIGLISYSLYLWHWGVLSISRWTIGIHWWSVPLQIALMFGLAVTSYRYIETPIRKGSWLGKWWKTLAFCGGFLIATAMGIQLSWRSMNKNLFLGDRILLNSIYSEEIFWDRRSCGTTFNSNNRITASEFENCYVSNLAQTSKEKHLIATVFAYGNSYNEQLVPAYLEIQRAENNYAFNAFYAAGCTAFSSLIQDKETNPGHCRNTYKNYLIWAKQKAKPGDIVILAFSLAMFSSEVNSKISLLNNSSLSGREALEIYIEEVGKLSAELKALGVKLYLTSSIPYLNAHPMTCRNWFTRYHNECQFGTNPIDASESLNDKTTQNLLNDNQTSGGYGFIDIYSPIRKLITFSPNPFIYYYNKTHLSALGAKSLTNEIFDKLKAE